MTKEEIYQLVGQTNIHVVSRKNTLKLIGHHESIVEYLFEWTFQVGDKNHVIASVLLEEVIRDNLRDFIPYIDSFLSKVSTVVNESAKRLISKICMQLVYSKQLALTRAQRKQLVHLSLDWLVSDSKVATEVFAMDILIKLRKEFVEEFQMGLDIVEVNYASKSAAYKNKAKKFVQYKNS